jgi:A/G-specific adenine glycosylase
MVSGTQSRFEGSDRQVRGRLMRALASGPVSIDAVASAAGLPDAPDRAMALMAALIADRLAIRDGARFTLP